MFITRYASDQVFSCKMYSNNGTMVAGPQVLWFLSTNILVYCQGVDMTAQGPPVAGVDQSRFHWGPGGGTAAPGNGRNCTCIRSIARSETCLDILWSPLVEVTKGIMEHTHSACGVSTYSACGAGKTGK